MLEGPAIEIAAQPSDKSDFVGIEQLDDRGQSDVQEAIARLEVAVGLALPVRLELRSRLLQHVGLGSKTALLLGVLQAVAASHDLGVSPTALQRACGRGGTSGVGIHGFFRGGFIVDSGRPQAEVTELAPSGAARPETLPLLTARLRVPAAWRFWLIQHEGPRIAGQDERLFFRRSTPIPLAEVHAALASTMHALVPAFALADLTALRHALASLQEIGFKRREVQAQPAFVQRRLNALLESGLPAGLSSMGPLVFVVTGSEQPPPILEELITERPDAFLGVFPGRNEGFDQWLGGER